MIGNAAQAAVDRPIRLRKRGDLVVHPVRYAGRKYLGIKDPLALRYFQLRQEEFFILQQLDGRRSLAEIQAAFEHAFAPRKLSVAQLQGFLAMLHRESLALADAEGQGEALRDRAKHLRRRGRIQRWSNVLALRFRGVDPEPVLARLYPMFRWAFSPWAIAACGLLILGAVTLVAVEFQQMRARLPEFSAFFHPRNVLWFVLAIFLAKLFHEFGHGLACKHFGGECHELGVMFLVFTPCLYMDVSDSWLLPSKWHRIAISSAGMIVEMVLAAGATFVWWFTAPGVLNSVCLHLMFVCSAGTVLLNGNPLLRYDGYFVLADLLEVPNLRERSTVLVRQALAAWLLGVEPSGQRLDPDRRRGLLVAYAVGATVYRWLVIMGILWFCHAVLRPHGLQVLAQVLTVLVLCGLVGVPLWRGVRFLSDPARSRSVRWRRFAWWSAAGGCLLTAALAVPLPHRVTADAVVQPAGGRQVFVAVGGKLAWAIEPGTEVRRGQVLGRLENPELQMEISRLGGRADVLAKQLDNLKQQSAQQAQLGMHGAAAQIPASEQALADVQEQLRNRLDERARLTLIAPADGVVLPPRRRVLSEEPGELDTWSGTPLDDENRGAFLDEGTVFSVIADPNRSEAILVLSQQDIDFVQTGQRVLLQLDSLPGRYLGGTIEELSEMDVDAAPPELIAAGRLPVRAVAGDKNRLVGVYYRAKAVIDDRACRLLPGSIGRARIQVAPMSLGRRILRYASGMLRLSA